MKNLDINEQRAEIDLLNEAFLSFNQASLTLKQSYADLEDRIAGLNLKLEEKNRELKKNLQEKEEVKNYLNNILESLTTGVIVVNPQGEITIFNKMAEGITGYSSKDAIKKRLGEIFNSQIFYNYARGGYLNSEVRFFEGETKFFREDNKRLHLKVFTSKVLNSDKEMMGTVIILQDISEFKRLEDQAGRSNRLMAMGEMAAKIVHEVRNPLGSIELFASLLKEDLKGDAGKEKIAKHIIGGVKSIDHVVSNLLLFTKSPRPALTKVEIQELLDEALTFAGPTITGDEEFRFIKKYACDDFMIHGDSEFLRQLFLNLILNAVQAMPSGGKLIISTAKDLSEFSYDLGSNKNPPREARDPFGLGFLKFSENTKDEVPLNRRFGQIKFIDSGMGISADIIDKVFDPFFSTKKKGMGLGLSIAHNIVDLHCGTIEVESQERVGTVFTINFPLLDSL